MIIKIVKRRMDKRMNERELRQWQAGYRRALEDIRKMITEIDTAPLSEDIEGVIISGKAKRMVLDTIDTKMEEN